MMISSFLPHPRCAGVRDGASALRQLVALAATTIASCLSFDMLHLLLPRLGDRPGRQGTIVIGESWITGGAAEKSATLTGIYASAFTGCQLAGPLLISRRRGTAISDAAAGRRGDLACLLMLRHLPTGSRERLAEQTSWRSLRRFIPVLASGVFCCLLMPACWRCCRFAVWIKG